MSIYTLAVTHRHYMTWRKHLGGALANNVGSPLLFLFGLSFGMGAFIDVMDGVPYLWFVVPGMIAQSAMFAASFEGALMSYIRFQRERIWDAVLATPVTLFELLSAEVLWASLKAMTSAVTVVIVGALIGGIPSLGGALVALVVVWIGTAMFAACGLVATSLARDQGFFSVFLTFWMTPMFVFSGVFFDIGRFPSVLQWFAWALPMTHLLAIVRPLTLGLAMEPGMVVLHMGVIVGVGIAAFAIAYVRIKAKVYD